MVIFLHGAAEATFGGQGEAPGKIASRLVTDEFFGNDIFDVKFIFPTSTNNDGVWFTLRTSDDEEDISDEEWYATYPDCEFGLLDECTQNLGEL